MTAIAHRGNDEPLPSPWTLPDPEAEGVADGVELRPATDADDIEAAIDDNDAADTDAADAAAAD